MVKIINRGGGSMSKTWTFLPLAKTCVLKKILGGEVLQPTPIPATVFPGSRFQVFSETFGLAILLGNPTFKQLVSGSSFPIFSSSQTFWFKNSSGN
jgi:hypothetical protein